VQILTTALFSFCQQQKAQLFLISAAIMPIAASPLATIEIIKIIKLNNKKRKLVNPK
jgi:hypothetical protein